MSKELLILECKCELRKKYRRLQDGGSQGQYVLELCEDCQSANAKDHLVSEEVIE